MKKGLTILGILICSISYAQQEYSFTQYSEALSYFNPAATGTDNTAKVVSLFRKQWIGFSGSPANFGLLYSTPIKKESMSLGGYVFQDMIGKTALTTAAVNYSYYINLSEHQRLAFGANMGIDFIHTNYDELRYWDTNDEVFNGPNENFTIPKIGFGLHYYTNNFYAGLSVPRMINYNSDEFNSIQNDRVPVIVSNYYGSIGYKFHLNEDFDLNASSLIKYTAHIDPQLDINALTTYKETVGLGIGYKTFGFASVYSQYIYKKFIFGYGYDFSLTPISKYSTGSHEVFIRYNIKTFKNTLPDKAFF